MQDRMLQFFAYAHLPPDLGGISKQFSDKAALKAVRDGKKD